MVRQRCSRDKCDREGEQKGERLEMHFAKDDDGNIRNGGDGDEDEKQTWKEYMTWIYTVDEAHGLFLRQRTVSGNWPNRDRPHALELTGHNGRLTTSQIGPGKSKSRAHTTWADWNSYGNQRKEEVAQEDPK